MKNVSGGNAENVCIVAFGNYAKMGPEENAHIVANPSAAGTDWRVSWCARECLYSSKSGRRRHRLGVEGAAGGRRGGVFFPPPLPRVDARGASHAASKVIALSLVLL